MGGDSKFEGGGGTFRPQELYRPSSNEANLNPDDEIFLNFQKRIINDLLKGQLDEDMLRRINMGPDMNPRNELMPWWYKPIS